MPPLLQFVVAIATGLGFGLGLAFVMAKVMLSYILDAVKRVPDDRWFNAMDANIKSITDDLRKTADLGHERRISALEEEQRRDHARLSDLATQVPYLRELAEGAAKKGVE